jgi:hypothetical protein
MTYTQSLIKFPNNCPQIFYLLILFSVAVCGWNHHLCIGPQSADPDRHGESKAVEEFRILSTKKVINCIEIMSLC